MKKMMGLIVIVSILTSTGLFGQVKFQYADFDYAKSTALKTQSPFFAYFASNNCEACRDMNTSTFNDLELATAVNGNANAYKVDIKTKSGEKWAIKFAVYKAPVFIFFDKNGNMAQRVEHPLTAGELKRLTEDPSSYHEMKPEFAALSENSISKDAAEATTVDYSESISGNDDSSETSNVDYTSESATTNYSSTTESMLPEPEVSFGVYAVQTGIFSNEDFAERMAKDLSNNYTYSINVRTEVIGGRTFFRVLLGDFPDEDSAKAAYRILINDGRSAFVRAK